ncbi:hypothetical protein PYW08_003707 [Mythimna loreyi]|uniref:Uncharacterized protein n=1 Tax=Mythimna loreyi TaxID=667449 RepID=A0ACC2QTF4_9NEOP|nr:hypothetical protein PYW08_003707 [Mythimna loreyi]
MERNNSKVRVFFIKILRILLTPISRFRKLIRKWSMRQTKIVIGVSATLTIIAVTAYLYWLFIFTDKENLPEKSYELVGTPLIHVPLDEIYKDLKPLENNDYNLLDDEQKEQVGMIHTPGCRIPLAVINYRKYKRNVTRNLNEMCGKRAVFLRKYDDDKVIARIKTRKMDRSTKDVRIQCCYKFIIDTLYNPHERDKILFSNCTDFQDESKITLQSDFINVICSEFDENNASNIIYEDMYAFNKKIKMKSEKNSCKIKYNVLILGMESMSLPRFLNTMPRTVAHFSDDSWLGFQGYNKIADDTLPNVMAALTGKNMTSIIKECFASMDDCNYMFIWKAFKDAGYATAYGEDNLGKTFSKDYAFHKKPTDHYMLPFFLKEEYRRNNISSCAGKISAGQQLLDYAVDFANTYKKESFFGFFWLNSFSRNEKNRPEYADKLIENFMNQLIYTGVLTNTFIMFLSAHGLRFGRHRLKMESFYDDRLPMKFIWTPLFFKGYHSDKYKDLVMNQRRLTTPYDIYSTLLDIKRISLCSNSSNPVPEGCPNCHSLLESISNNRTCKEVGIHERWCTCHKLYPLTVQDPIGLQSVDAAVSYIQGKTANIETQSCWGCARPSLQNVTRIHFYYDEDKTKTFYVVAISMSPGNATYEALVLRKDGYRVVGPVSPISYYQGTGKCALRRKDRLFCFCQKDSKFC